MFKKIIEIIKEAAIFFCVIFTIATLANSIGVAWFGHETNPDVHGHIILRAGVCLVITIIVTAAQNIHSFYKDETRGRD